MTAPASRTSHAVEGSACTTLDLRFISRFVRSWTLLVRRRFQCDGGKSRYARASSSASSRIASVLGRHPSSMSQATWYMAATVAASRPRARGTPARRAPAHAAPQLPGARLAHAVAHEVDGAALPCGALEASPSVRTRPGWASETTSSTPPTPRLRILLRKASHVSYDSVSTTSTPRTRLQPSATQPMAVTAAVEATRPPRRHLT